MNSALLSFKSIADQASFAIISDTIDNDGLPTVALTDAIKNACARIAPLWSLQHFVAVNPFMGLSERLFIDTCKLASNVGYGQMLMPTEFYANHYHQGRITTTDIEHALALTGSKLSLQQCLSQLGDAKQEDYTKPWPTLANYLDSVYGQQWTTFVTEEISKWCSAYFDEGQSAWRMPWRALPLYSAWRRAAEFDHTPELAGIHGFQRCINALPEQPIAAISQILSEMGITIDNVEDFCHRQLLTVSGWSAWVRHKTWQGKSEQIEEALIELLAICLAYEYALLLTIAKPQDFEAWRQVWQQPLSMVEMSPQLEGRYIMQWAYELSLQRRQLSKLMAPLPIGVSAQNNRKIVQAVFCIDVRSEVYRRALESTSSYIQTFGFAGFFGFPIEYIAIGHQHGQAQCPVLIQPKFKIRESVINAAIGDLHKILHKRWLHKRLNRLWKGFKNSAVSCFSYVEISGLSFAFKLFSDSLGLTRTVTRPSIAGLDKRVVHRIGPVIPRQRGRLIAKGPLVETGIALNERIELAHKALQGMGLTDDFARLVLLCGHGSTTVNNPYAAGLDCGACGGHSGEVNARVAASVLNAKDVRGGLATLGVTIPQETWFIAGLHDTTTDQVRLFDLDQVPDDFSNDLVQLQCWLDTASQLSREERAPSLPSSQYNAASLLKSMVKRSRDWAQIRPEWGLAGNSAFIAAPRQRTSHANLDGQVFLHNYDYRQDADGAILSLIMTAPMVVASWINLQYYASTVDNLRFGSGNKVLHNVVGTLGILEGNGGDLRMGLPWQSLHDGKTLRHEPVRLTVIIEAPTAMIEAVLEHHNNIRELFDNDWLHLMCIEPIQNCCLRYCGPQRWYPVSYNIEE